MLNFLQAIYKIKAGEDRGIVDFNNTAVTDMPPKLRAVFEENKVCRWDMLPSSLGYPHQAGDGV